MREALQHTALLFAVPTCESELEQMLAGQVLPDYRNMFDDNDDRARDEAAPILAEAERLIELAASGGAAVFRQATLDDFSKASADHSVLIYFGHSRGFEVSEQDLPMFEAWRDRAQCYAGHPVLAALNECRSAHDAANAMTTLLTNRTLLPMLPPKVTEAIGTNDAMAWMIGRELIDDAFAGVIRPGNMVEMFDGLHSPGRFVDKIAASFRGELDLTMCHSIAVAAMLDLRRGGNIRHLHWPVSVDPAAQFMLVAAALRELVERDDRPPGSELPSYISIRLRLHRNLLEGG